jgi:hypothetical protein
MVETEAYKNWRMCGRKKAFETQSKANKAARLYNQYVYQCPICFCWHLTKKEQVDDGTK